MTLTANRMDFDFSSPALGIALFTFLYVDLLDTTGNPSTLNPQPSILSPSSTSTFAGKS
jgi:hypothetical protein